NETCTPGMTAPVASWTLPVIEPDVFCAFSVQLNVSRIRTIRHISSLSPKFLRCIDFSSIGCRVVYTAAKPNAKRKSDNHVASAQPQWSDNPRLLQSDFDYDERVFQPFGFVR